MAPAASHTVLDTQMLVLGGDLQLGNIQDRRGERFGWDGELGGGSSIGRIAGESLTWLLFSDAWYIWPQAPKHRRTKLVCG